MANTERQKKIRKKANDWDRLNEIVKIKERSLNLHIEEMDELRRENNELQTQLRSKEQGTRYFFVCTMGKRPNGSIGFNNFDIQTTDEHPTIKRCVELSNELYPNMTEVVLLSISEISAEDWNVFISEQ
jgi:hypothetical protein